MYVHYFNDSSSFLPVTHASDIKTDNEENNDNDNDNGNDNHDDSSGLCRKCEGQHRWGTWFSYYFWVIAGGHSPTKGGVR